MIANLGKYGITEFKYPDPVVNYLGSGATAHDVAKAKKALKPVSSESIVSPSVANAY